jgi:hypothetical protein
VGLKLNPTRIEAHRSVNIRLATRWNTPLELPGGEFTAMYQVPVEQPDKYRRGLADTCMVLYCVGVGRLLHRAYTPIWGSVPVESGSTHAVMFTYLSEA